MKDSIEDFIDRNREGFEPAPPPAAIWEKLQGNLAAHHQRKNKTLLLRPVWWSIAAAAVILIGLGLFLFSPAKQTATNALVKAEPANAVYTQSIVYYTRLVQSQQQQLANLQNTNPALYAEFKQDIDELDQSYGQLKTQLPQSANQEQVLESMIQNLKMQETLLGRQLQLIKKIKSSPHEKSTQSI